MAISQTIFLPDTHATFPHAYGVIVDGLLNLAQGITEIKLNWYVNQSELALGALPVRTDNIHIATSFIATENPTFVSGLTLACLNGNIKTSRDALLSALYLILISLPAYSDAISI